MNRKIRICMKSYDHGALQRACQEITSSAIATGARVHGPVPMPRKIMKVTVLSSPHIDKKARNQFEIRTYKRLVDVECTDKTLEALTALVMPSEVDVEIKV